MLSTSVGGVKYGRDFNATWLGDKGCVPCSGAVVDRSVGFWFGSMNRSMDLAGGRRWDRCVDALGSIRSSPSDHDNDWLILAFPPYKITPSAWPILVIISGAVVFCGGFITKKLAFHPDVRITASKRAVSGPWTLVAVILI